MDPEGGFFVSMRIINLVTSILHVYSEKTGRWIPPPEANSFAAIIEPELERLAAREDDQDLFSLTKGDWDEITTILLSRAPDIFPRKLLAGAKELPLDCVDFFAGFRSAGATYLPFWSDGYPPLLREIPDPPLGLSVAGDAALATKPSVAVVGSRFAAGWAVEWATGFGRLASDAGIAVVSGGAYGCDAAVHAGMLQGRFDEVGAIVVFAGGLDCPYPRHNIRLFEDIVASGGCLVSERGPGSRCRPHDFLARNRIISGLATGTVIVQAAERSGAMVTARFAADQGREVMVVRPPRADVRAAGNEILLGDGAHELGQPADAIGGLIPVLMSS
jgi:DNA protecting protein DprA